MRLMLCATLTIAMCGLAGAFEDPKDEKPSAADQFKAVQKEFQEFLQPLNKEFQAAKTDKERDALREKFRGMAAKNAEKALKVALDNAKDPASFDAALWALQQGEGAVTGKAADFIVANHADNAKLKPMLARFGGMGESGQKLLQGLHEKATDKGTKGLTLFYLASGKVESADRDVPGKVTPPETRAAAFKDAETMLAKLAKEYGEVEIPSRGEKSQTVAKAVEDQLFFINNLTVGKVLPDSSVEDLDGKKVKISDHRGKVVVLDVWATWCGPCVAMIPHERELVKKMDGKPFVFISLSADAKKETLTKFLEKQEMPWTHWWNGGAEGAALETYKVRFYPTIYVLDEKGVIRFKHVRGDDMDKAVETLVKDVKTKG